jgi:hypothetical protein
MIEMKMKRRRKRMKWIVSVFLLLLETPTLR